MNEKEIYRDEAQNISWAHRTMCDVFEEMRSCVETLNFSYLSGLIEEGQAYANRMEAKLSDVREYGDMKDRYKAMREAVEKAESKKEA